MSELPKDCREFLREAKQFQFDPHRVMVGRIRLKSFEEVSESVIELFAANPTAFDDPYGSFRGTYQIPVVDLVAESDQYEAQGLFCWIPLLDAFGTIDREHGEILVFTGTDWQAIVKNPTAYLDAQWEGHSAAKTILPWLYFPFQFSDRGEVLPPYPKICPLHRKPIVARKVTRNRLCTTIQYFHLDDWLHDSQSLFPHAGVPVSRSDLLHCAECQEEENRWVEHVAASLPMVDATMSKAGFVTCPGCGRRFAPRDSNVFLDQIHLKCGQKIQVIV